MSEHEFDVVGIGSAIVDVICRAEVDFVEAQGLAKGTMQLIDAERSEELYGAMPPAIERSGGSIANTVAGVASFGGAGGFVGKVRNDQFGEVFTHDIRTLGIDYEVPAATEGPPTARCLIVVTPDADRTMNTYLGIAGQLQPADIDEAFVSRGKVVICEGYLWDVPAAKEAITTAMDHVRAAGGRAAFSLSDPFCVDRYRTEFVELLEARVDVLFANETEICSLYEVDDWDVAVDRVRGHVEIACLTRSEKGSVIVAGNDAIEIPAHPVAQVVDTTGAGDLYAAGVIYGLTHGEDLERCGRMGALAAAEVISHIGARPEVPLVELLADLT